MHRTLKHLRRTLAGRSGLTLLEVLIAMGVFLIGSVGIVALFVTASVLHSDASDRRKAAFIADELLDQVNALRMRDVFAVTALTLDQIPNPFPNIEAAAVTPDQSHYGALFNQYPLCHLFWPLQPGQSAVRSAGPILIDGDTVSGSGSEWAWYTVPPAPPPNEFVIAATDRGLWDDDQWVTAGLLHSEPGVRILQPRTWFYVVADQDAVLAGDQPLLPAAAGVIVRGNPLNLPVGPPAGAPPQGYIVIDEEWMPYDGRDGTSFSVADLDNDGNADRGWGRTMAVAHNAGTPVTVARPHPYYPGFYYTVQFYPVNATGTEAHVVVSVGYGTVERFRVDTFRSVYSPAKF